MVLSTRTTFRFGPAPTTPLHSPTLTSVLHQDWRIVHQVADAHVEAIYAAVRQGFKDAKALVDPEALAVELHKTGHVESIDWQAIADAFSASFTPVVSAVAKASALALLPSFTKQVKVAHPLTSFSDPLDAWGVSDGKGGWIGNVTGKPWDTFSPGSTVASPQLDPWAKLGFDLQHLGADTYLKIYSPDKITEVTSGVRDAINQVTQSGFKNGIDVYYQGKAISQMVGLSAPQGIAYRTKFDSLRGEGYSNARISSLMEAWSQKAIAYRANVIARTESLRAANGGQKILWSESQKNGLLDPVQTNQIWIATDDDRECPICAALNGQSIPLDGAWTSSVSGATAEIPPIHTSCRCAMGLDFSQASSSVPDGTLEEILPPPLLVEGAPLGDVPFANYTEDPKYRDRGLDLRGADTWIHNLQGDTWAEWSDSSGIPGGAVSSLKAYTGESYTKINEILRDDDLSAATSLNKNAIDKIDAAFEKVPGLSTDVDLFRNIGLRSISRALGVEQELASPWDFNMSGVGGRGPELAAKLTEQLKGTRFSDPAYMSATVDPRAAFSSKPVRIIIETPAGAKLIYLEPITVNGGEFETLFPRGSVLEFKSMTYIGESSEPGNRSLARWEITARLILPTTP